MKISWGHKILFTYLAFVAGMMGMVYFTTQQNRDLVSDNYYADELAFQKIIDESANTAALQSPSNPIPQTQTLLSLVLFGTPAPAPVVPAAPAALGLQL